MCVTFKSIRHVQQPTSDTCIAACCAMLIGDKEIDAEFHTNCYIDGAETIVNYLNRRDVKAWRPTYDPEQMPHRLGQGFIFLVQAPSLNWENALHMVVVDYRTEHPQVFDPNKGKDGLLAYEKIGHGVHDLRNWTVEAVVDAG